MAAAVTLGERRFLRIAHHPDDPRTERPRPLAEQQTDTAGCGMHEDPVVAPDLVRAAQQVVRRQTFEHQRCGLLVADRSRHLDEAVSRDIAQVRVASRLAEHIGHTVADPEAAHATTDGRHSARRLAAETTRQRHRVKTAPVVDVYEIEADGGVAHRDFAHGRRTRIEILEDQRLWATALVQTDGLRHTGQSADSSVSPVRMRITRSMSVMKILPSPTLPVLAAFTMPSTT